MSSTATKKRLEPTWHYDVGETNSMAYNADFRQPWVNIGHALEIALVTSNKQRQHWWNIV